MKMTHERKKIWMITKEKEALSEIKEFEFSSEKILEDRGSDKDKFLKDLGEQLGQKIDKTAVLKLRNTRGSLIPLNRKTPQNTITSPYTLEICQRYATVQPSPRQVSMSTYSETYQRKLEHLTKRIAKLESIVPDLADLRNAKLNAEMQEIEKMMQFLDSKLKEAESRQWKGMFRKHPLW